VRWRPEEREFLPAVLELQETPPSPVGRLILWSIMLIFGAGVAWAWWGEVDIVATAQGKVVPSGRVKVVQPMETGVVRAIRVREGQAVAAGEVLIELDPTAAEADQSRLETELAGGRVALRRLALLTDALEDPLSDAGPLRTPADSPAGPSPHRVPEPTARAAAIVAEPTPLSPLEQRILEGQLTEFHARLATFDHAIAERSAALAAARETVTKLERTLPLVAQRADALKALADRQMGATADYLAIEQTRIEQAQDLRVQQERARELEGAIARSRAERAAAQAEYTRARYQERVEAERRVAALTEELAKAHQRVRLQTLTAPVDGVVQQLAVHTPGGVVTPAQVLMHIVPRDDRLEVDARLPNKDIGFVEEGQTAEVKVETFPFTRYGTLQAEIIDVADDAVPDDKTGLYYPLRARLSRTVMDVDGRPVRLTAGMAVTLEVRTGTRRIIEFALSPLLQGLNESGRER